MRIAGVGVASKIVMCERLKFERPSRVQISTYPESIDER
jgi:hypothetical protein